MDGDRPVRAILRRAAGRRRGQRMMAVATSLRSKLGAAAAARRGRGFARPRDRRAARARRRRASQSRFLRHHLQRAGDAARSGLPGARLVHGLHLQRAGEFFLALFFSATRASTGHVSAAARRSPAREFQRRRLLRPRRSSAMRPFLDRMTCYGNLSLDRHPLRGRGVAAGQRMLRRPMVQSRRCSPPAPTCAASKCMAAPGWSARRVAERHGGGRAAARLDPQLRLSLDVIHLGLSAAQSGPARHVSASAVP